MRTILGSRLLIGFTLSATVLSAHQTVRSLLAEAVRLRQEGQLQASITLLESTLGTKSVPERADEEGMAWNVLGSAYQSTDRYQSAQRCYEHALKLLVQSDAWKAEYASALDNLGSLEFLLGHLEESQALRRKAQNCYRSLQDFAGITRTDINLTLIALAQHHRRAARKAVKDASRNAELAPKLSVDDKAALCSARGEVMSADGQFASAIQFFTRAIELWTAAFGADGFRLSAGYALLGKTQLQVGDFAAARLSLTQALEIQKKLSGGNESIMGLRIQMLYAQLLFLTGSKAESIELETHARTALIGLYRQRCYGCSVSVDSLTH